MPALPILVLTSTVAPPCADGQTMITRTSGETTDDEPTSVFVASEGGWRRPFLASVAVATGGVLQDGTTRFTKAQETSDDEPPSA